MALRIVEWFGFRVSDSSPNAVSGRNSETCPFIEMRCTKRLGDGTRSGVCAVGIASESKPVIICPNRLYSDAYGILRDIAKVAFGYTGVVIQPNEYQSHAQTDDSIVAFGKYSGGELRLPGRGRGKGYFVDWILARVKPDGELAEFVAVEVQSIDTTGSYKPEVLQLRSGNLNPEISKAGLNWENVNKRILPQLIYKGQVLRREPLCLKGLFFVSPSAVNTHIRDRLGNNLLAYENLQPGSISFMWYSSSYSEAGIPGCTLEGRFSTTVDQVANALSATADLPPQGVYEEAIRMALDQL